MRWHCPPDTWFEIEPCWSAAKHVISRSCWLPTIFNLYDWAGRKHFVLWNLECQSRRRICDLWLSKQAPGPRPLVLLLHIQTHHLITDIKIMCYVFLLVSISWLAKRFQLLIFMTLMMYYIGLNIYNIYFFICVVKTHLCSTEAIDNVGLYNDVVIRAYNTDVLVIRGWQYYIIKWRDRQFKWR